MATQTITQTTRGGESSLRLGVARTLETDAAVEGLPVPNPTTSYWQAEASGSALHDHGKDTLLPSPDQIVDVAIIGSGISGAVAAYMLMAREGDAEGRYHGSHVQHQQQGKPKAPPSVVMLEARRACSGATGRNGGHCRPDTFAGFAKYASIVGEQQAHKVLQNEWDTFVLTDALCRGSSSLDETDFTEPIDCDWWRGQTLGVYRSQDIKEASKEVFERYKEFCGGQLRDGVRFIDDEAQAREISRVPDAVGAAVWPAGSLHPLRFVHELLRRCLARPEFQLYTSCPVETLHRGQDGLWRVATPRGSVKARTVLVGTNGYSTKLVPELSAFLTPHRSQCSSIAPPSAYSGPLALSMTASIIKGGGDYEYLTQRPSRGGPNTPHQADREGDAIFILGGGHPVAPRNEQVGTFDDSVVNDAITEHLRAYPATAFADWQDGDGNLTHIWTGIQGYTRDSLPIVGEQPGKEGLFLSLGHHGHGMARAATCARGIARLILASLDDPQDSPQANTLTDEQWELATSLPSCYRWSEARAQRRDVDCRGDF